MALECPHKPLGIQKIHENEGDGEGGDASNKGPDLLDECQLLPSHENACWMVRYLPTCQ